MSKAGDDDFVEWLKFLESTANDLFVVDLQSSEETKKIKYVKQLKEQAQDVEFEEI